MPCLSERNAFLLKEEQALWSEGYTTLAGIDEAGRGPLAGPVVASCVSIPQGIWIEGIYDSKKLSETKREKLYQQLVTHPKISYGVGQASSEEIDQINILQATFLAMRRAYENLQTKVDFVLVDGLYLPLPVPSRKLIKGDARSYLVASASIIAKVTRDRLLKELDERWPMYGFAQHKGYGTQKHRKAILEYGPCAEHRKTFEPIKSLLVETT